MRPSNQSLAGAALLMVLSLAAFVPLHSAMQIQAPTPQDRGGQTPAAGGVQGNEPKFRLVRSVAGSKGSEQGGRYIIEDPRTVFYIPEDREVIVYFEWDGPLGPHHFEGLWKNSEGKALMVSDFNYEAKQKRFGGYWTLPLLDSTPSGIWTIEARVDGEVTGTHTIQVVVAAKPAPATPPIPQTPFGG